MKYLTLLIGICMVAILAMPHTFVFAAVPYTVLSHNLSYGMRDTAYDSSIAQLQRFLGAQGYMSSWLVTGYFGKITRQAVKNYQYDHDVPPTGRVDELTRTIIARNIGINGTITAGPALSSYNATSAMTLTLYGSGFSSQNNTVYIDGIAIYNSYSNNGTSLSVSTSNIGSGNYLVYVRDAQGRMSNNLSVTINQQTGGTIQSINGPTYLNRNEQGTWNVQTNNPYYSSLDIVAYWGDGTSQTKTSYYSGNQSSVFTHTYTNDGTYTITFMASDVRGYQTSKQYTVTVSGYGYTNQLSLSSISPSSARSGSTIVLYGNGFDPLNNTVHFGSGGSNNSASSNNGTVIYYHIPYIVSGTYPVYVSNYRGQTNTMFVTVTQ